ncbi:MAG: serine protein kinase RIO [Candidatus Caldarchaeum sp.]|nr:serine protein kinase RIO [Candidatus Caldarchaeum sp.]MCX8201098.1 serine protein kinase RIO [Candidatus Caldarchaeum sp.]MDW8063155.1 serine protein kinase RIO [Candidatus Caldarchaeum sp.]
MKDGIERLEKRLRQREFRKERQQRYLEKRSELDESLEEVFDQRTLLTLYDLLNVGHLREVYGVISAGKESRVYHGVASDGAEVAVKIYLISSAEFRRNRLQYVAEDPRFKTIPTDFRKFIYLWARREYANIVEAFQANVAVPKPYVQKENVLVMQFLGENGVRYPLLVEETFEPDELENIREQLIENIRKLYHEADMVHGDLSEYNVVVAKNLQVYLIDMAQAVKRGHPLAETLLAKGVETLCNFFNKRGLHTDSEDMVREILAER